MTKIEPKDHDQLKPSRIIDTRKNASLSSELEKALIHDSGIKAVLGTAAPDNHEPCVVLVTGENAWIVMSVPMARQYIALYRVVFNQLPEDIELVASVNRVIANLATTFQSGSEVMQ